MHHLVGTAEIAEILAVSKQRVSQLSTTTTFPAPEVVLASGRVWRRDVIEAWAQTRTPHIYSHYADASRALIVAWQAEARRLGHPEMEPEHLLLAILRLPKLRPASQMLRDQQVTAGKVRRQLIKSLPPNADAAVAEADLRNQNVVGGPKFSAESKRVLRYVMAVALMWDAPLVEPEHFIAAMLWEEDGRAREFLAKVGADPEAIAQSVLSWSVNPNKPQ